MTLGFIAAVIWFYRGSKGKDEITILITMVGGLASAVFFIQKQKLEELHLFKELFVDFNRRYDGMNEEINRIASVDSKAEFSSDEKNRLNDYFNLCAEEFLFYTRGYIYPEVWRAWHNGMKSIINSDGGIRKYWEQEKKTDSFYGLEV